MGSRLEVAAQTDEGVVRRRNEDAFYVRDLSADGVDAWLLAVADGMGGMAGGQMASSQTVATISEMLTAWPDEPFSLLKQVVVAANERLRNIGIERPELFGMGTTLVTALVRDGVAWLANVGDSRAYLIRSGAAKRVTEDHSWVGEQVRAGHLTEEEAAVHPRRNIITRSVGSEPKVEPEFFGPMQLQSGDVLLLCSDGLYEVVSNEEMADLVGRFPPKEAASEMVALANKNGGPDNITVVIGRLA